MGAGVALFDYDNDGRLDLFLVNGAPLSDPTPKGTIPQKTGPQYWNRLYHQKPDGTFEDVTAKAGLEGFGYGMGAAVADYDNDGNQDLFVTAYGGNRLYHNNGDGTFTDVTENAGVAGGGWSTSAAWVDLDDDGLLDLIVCATWNGISTISGAARTSPASARIARPTSFSPSPRSSTTTRETAGSRRCRRKSAFRSWAKGSASPSPITIMTATSTFCRERFHVRIPIPQQR